MTPELALLTDEFVAVSFTLVLIWDKIALFQVRE